MKKMTTRTGVGWSIFASFSGGDVWKRSGLRVPWLVGNQLFPDNVHVIGSFDSDSNAFRTDAHDRDTDIRTDPNPFPLLAT